MSKYGFDYFSKKAQLLNEMARPASVFGKGSSPTQAYAKARTYMKQKYGIDSGTLDRRIFGYLYQILPDELITPEEESAIGIGSKKSTADFKNAITSVVQRLLKSGELDQNQFAADLTNEERIDQYMQGVSGMTTGSRAQGMENEVRSTTGIGANDFRQLIAATEPLRKEINKIMAGRKISRAKMGDASKYNTVQAPDAKEQSPDMDFASKLLSTLEKFINLKHELDSTDYDEDQLDEGSYIISQIPIKELEKTYDMYENMLDSGTGTTEGDLEKLIGKLSANPKAPKAFIAFLTLLKDQASQHESSSDTSVEDTRYDGYDEDVIAKVLDSPEKRELFDRWYKLNNRWREQKNAELESRFIQQLINANFFDKRGMDADGPKQMSPEILKLMAQKETFQNKLNQSLEYGDDVAAQKYQKFINTIDKTIKHLQGENTQPEDEEDSGIMGYMTEQVSKDSHVIRKDAKFVDRGFKRPVNYWQWLESNR